MGFAGLRRMGAEYGARKGAFTVALAFASAGIGLFPQSAHAERIANPVAVFSGIDKITGRITTFDVYINETVQFGALQVTPKVCYSRDESEAQQIDAFVEVDEITLDRKIRRIFSGWMFAASPALNAVEHAIYDVWLKECKASSDVPAPVGVKPAQPAPVPNAPQRQPQTSESAPQEPQPERVDPNADQLTENPQGQQPMTVPPLEAPQVIEDMPAVDAVPQGQPLQVPRAPGGVGLY